MKLFYCNPKTQDELLKKVYDYVMKDPELHTQDSRIIDLLQLKTWEDYKLKFDPLDSKEDPVQLYIQLIAKIPERIDWIKNSIEKVLLQSPFLISNGPNLKLEIKNCAFRLLAKINDGFTYLADFYPSALKYLVESYLNKVMTDDFEIKKLDSEEVGFYLDRIEIEEINAFEPINEFQMRPIKKRILVFHVRIDIDTNKTSDSKSFDWNGSIEGLKQLNEYWIEMGYIKTINFQYFHDCFKKQPIENIKEKLTWTYRAKGGTYTAGLIVDFIARLASQGLISEEFHKKSYRDLTIKGCFIMEDNSIPKVDDKKVTSRLNWTKAIKQFDEFLSKIPSLPS